MWTLLLPLLSGPNGHRWRVGWGCGDEEWTWERQVFHLLSVSKNWTLPGARIAAAQRAGETNSRSPHARGEQRSTETESTVYFTVLQHLSCLLCAWAKPAFPNLSLLPLPSPAPSPSFPAFPFLLPLLLPFFSFLPSSLCFLDAGD